MRLYNVEICDKEYLVEPLSAKNNCIPICGLTEREFIDLIHIVENNFQAVVIVLGYYDLEEE